ncbi:MAG: DivIVA domain-containing protein [Desulfobacterales bacterium]|nr:MAG: DivIVA domain-containing protein [Desulfobacterales bacterium]
MKLTPLDIQQQQFKTRFRGFDVREVDTFLEQMSGAFEKALSKNESLHEEIRRLKLESQGYKEREETFKRAMLNSQKILEEMKKNAQKSAELIVAEAEVKAEKILNRAQNRLAQLHEDIAELKRQRMQIEIQIRTVIESHAKLLEIGIEETQTMEEEDEKLKLLKQSK